VNNGRTVLYGEVRQIKREFAGNAVVVSGEGSFENISGVLESRAENGTWHMTLAANTNPQDICRLLADQDDVRIGRFEVAEPSLNDIFISVVKAGHGQLEADHA
jgi:ABC-2 type transport system ATP-binding protein